MQSVIIKKISRSAVVAIGVSLVALAAGLALGYYGSDNRPAAGYKCEVEDICGLGPALAVTPAVTVAAAGPQMMLDEVVSYAPGPRLTVREVIVVAERAPAETRVN